MLNHASVSAVGPARCVILLPAAQPSFLLSLSPLALRAGAPLPQMKGAALSACTPHLQQACCLFTHAIVQRHLAQLVTTGWPATSRLGAQPPQHLQLCDGIRLSKGGGLSSSGLSSSGLRSRLRWFGRLMEEVRRTSRGGEQVQAGWQVAAGGWQVCAMWVCTSRGKVDQACKAKACAKI